MIVLAAGAVAVLVVLLSFRVDILKVWPTRSDEERIQGEWKLVSAMDSGRTVSESGSCVFEGETVTFDFGDHDVTCTYHLDDSHRPGWIDLIVPDQGTPMRRGIYELVGETLRICLNERFDDERPNAFESRSGSPNDLLMVLKR